jgi:hypothetical protein
MSVDPVTSHAGAVMLVSLDASGPGADVDSVAVASRIARCNAWRSRPWN